MDTLFATRELAGTNVLVAEGEIDLFTAPRLRCRVDALLEAGRREVVLDLRPVTFLDTAGLGVLVQCSAAADRHGASLRLVCSQPHLLKVFRITGLDRVFVLHADLASAGVAA
jgi:anti-sigma B factor antagonist